MTGTAASAALIYWFSYYKYSSTSTLLQKLQSGSLQSVYIWGALVSFKYGGNWKVTHKGSMRDAELMQMLRQRNIDFSHCPIDDRTLANFIFTGVIPLAFTAWLFMKMMPNKVKTKKYSGDH